MALFHQKCCGSTVLTHTHDILSKDFSCCSASYGEAARTLSGLERWYTLILLTNNFWFFFLVKAGKHQTTRFWVHPYVYIGWLCGIFGQLPSDPCSALWIITATYGEEASVMYRSSNPSLRGSTSPYASNKDETKIAGANYFDSTGNQSRQGKVVLRGTGTNHSNITSLCFRGFKHAKLRELEVRGRGENKIAWPKSWWLIIRI